MKKRRKRSFRNIRGRSSYDTRWEQTKLEAFNRDGNKCQFVLPNGKKCGRKKNLQPHHIIRKCDCPSLIYSASNVITLCGYHHHIVTGYEHVYVPVFRKIIKENS